MLCTSPTREVGGLLALADFVPGFGDDSCVRCPAGVVAGDGLTVGSENLHGVGGFVVTVIVDLQPIVVPLMFK